MLCAVGTAGALSTINVSGTDMVWKGKLAIALQYAADHILAYINGVCYCRDLFFTRLSRQ
jgi:hypothetical protein